MPRHTEIIISTAEKTFLDRVLNTIRRNDLLLLGDTSHASLINDICVSRTFFLDPLPPLGHQRSCCIQATFRALPVRSESMDIVLCAHALDRADDCDATLQEIYRVLKPDGNVILFGFNRWSLWRLFHFFTRRPFFEKNTYFHSMDGIVSTLEAIGFDITSQQTACFCFPTQRKQWRFFETIGQLLLPSLGAVYMIVATKNVVGMTPLFESIWPKKISTQRVIEPSRRSC